ncbi:MAG: glycosyltransferase family A protein [Cyanobacteria bacterium P01_D01_bin.1]
MALASESIMNEKGLKTEHEVSVIIPAYNAIRYLPRALESVLNQTYQNFDVVIVDDGSQDGIGDWYAQLSEDIRQQVKLISRANKGTASARNLGIARSHSPYIAFLDADDIWLPEKLAQQVQALKNSPEAGLVYCWVASVDQMESPTGRLYAERLQPQRAWETLVVRNVISTPSAVLVCRECLQAVGGFDTTLKSYVEDKELWLRIARHYPIQVLPEVLVHKRRHWLNMSKDWQAMEYASYQVLDRAFASPPVGMSDRTLKQLQRQSYGELNRHLAWKPLQTDEVMLGVAIDYLRKSWTYCPRLILSKESVKLLSAMLAITLVGTVQYRQWLRHLAKARHWVSSYKLSLFN